MLRTLFNKMVKEPLKALQNSNFVNAFRAMLQPRHSEALVPVRIDNSRSSNGYHLRR